VGGKGGGAGGGAGRGRGGAVVSRGHPGGGRRGRRAVRCYRQATPLGSGEGEGRSGAIERRPRWGPGRAKGGPVLSRGDPAGVRRGRGAVRCYREETPPGSGGDDGVSGGYRLTARLGL